MDVITFDQFMEEVDAILGNMCCGLGHDDFVEIMWYDLYEATNGDAQDEEIYIALAEADAQFSGFYALHLSGNN